MNPPLCPTHNIEMVINHITQGDQNLGYFWACPVDDCTEAEDLREGESVVCETGQSGKE